MSHMPQSCHTWIISHLTQLVCIFFQISCDWLIYMGGFKCILGNFMWLTHLYGVWQMCFGQSHVIGSFIWGVSNVFWAISCDWLIYMGFGKCVLGNLMCLTPVYGGLQMYFGQSRVFDLFLWGFANVFWAISCCCRTPYKWVMSSVNKSISHVMNKSCHIQMSNVAHLVCT